MRKLLFLLAIAGFVRVDAQTMPQMQHPGSICCNQNICPGESIGEINEELPTMPPPSQANIEYAWYELVDDSTSASGTKWVKLPNTNMVSYQPTTFSSQFGGFYMRGARLVGTLPYMFSNIVNVKELSSTNPICTSSTGEASASSAVLLSPNPASHLITASTNNEAIPIHGYRIVALGGNTLLQGNIEPATSVQLDIQSLPSGIYFLELILNEGKTSFHKWVKL